MGGFASGFAELGFKVTGVDKSEVAGETFELNGFGKFLKRDLSKKKIRGDYQVLIGGPPCRPWSSVNTVKRGKEHPDYRLVGVFFKHVLRLKPKAFLFENVPPVGNSGTYKWWIKKVKEKYSVSPNLVQYSEFGAATQRRRFMVFGMRNEGRKNGKGSGTTSTAESFADLLAKHKSPAATVRSRIWDLREKAKNSESDHEWPALTTIENYRHLYASGKYGWYKLEWDEPAPSFGNVMKTYILHPESFNGGVTRVISVREAFLVMGFDEDFSFPEETGIGARYQMIADSVSPMFSRAVAQTVKEILTT